MLNYGYAVLAGRVKLAIACAGLDPAVGFMHAPQKAKMAPRSPLVLDLMEPMRPLVDRAVLEFAMREPLDPEAFSLVRKSPVLPSGAVRLKDDMARTVAVIADNAIHYSPIKLFPKPLNLLHRH
jgi:CRISPR-associated protein Cas1